MDDFSVLEPFKLYDERYREEFAKNSDEYFDEMVKKSKIDVETNRKLVGEIEILGSDMASLKKKLSGKRAVKTLLVLLCVITAVFAVLFALDAASAFGADISVVFACSGYLAVVLAVVCIGLNVASAIFIGKIINKKIKALKDEIAEKDELLRKKRTEAKAILAPLYGLFDWNMPADVIKRTTPLIEFDKFFDVRKFCYIRKKYGFGDNGKKTESSWLIHSGAIVGNPFLFIRTFACEMYDKTYDGYLTIHWTTHSTDSDGHTVVEHHSQTLHASVTAPAPRYDYFTKLVYVNDAAPDLCFSRKPSGADRMSEKEREKAIKRGEKALQKKEVKSDLNFTAMSNIEFDVFFGALDRNDEQQFRLLFTPLAQQNMLDLIKSNKYYGDDFTYKKSRGINEIVSSHAQQADLFASPYRFDEYSFDELRKRFNDYNCEFFKSVYFDLAPLVSVPLFQQHKPTEYIYDKDYLANYTSYEHESLANSFSRDTFAHERTKTNVIIKSERTTTVGDSDVVEVSAHSFDAIDRVTYVSVWGDDGNIHDVPVDWVEYIPLKKNSYMQVKKLGLSEHDFRNLMDNSDFSSIVSKKSDGRCVFERGLFAMALSADYTLADEQKTDEVLKSFCNRNDDKTEKKS